MSRRTILLISVVIILGIGGVVGYKIWNKPFKDPLEGNAIKITAIQLFDDFNNNESAALKKYVPEKTGEKTVEVSGEIKEIGKNQDGETFYNLKTSHEMFSVKCIMDKGKEIENANVGDKITVRGFCDGYNLDVIVNRCKPVKV